MSASTAAVATSCGRTAKVDQKTPSVQIAFAFAAGVVHVYDFQFGIEVESGGSLFAIADAGSFDPSDGDMGFASRGRRVDMRHARFDLVNETKNACSII